MLSSSNWILALVIVLATSACSLQEGSNDGSTRVAGEGVIQQFPADDRERVEQFSGTLLSGEAFASKELEGRIVVYNMWGSWCAPCRKEAPALRRAAAAFEPFGVRFVGLNVKDSEDAARAFERRYRIAYPSLRSADSARALLAFGARLSASAVPTTLVVDERGRLAARVLGVVTYSTVAGVLEDLGAEAVADQPSS